MINKHNETTFKQNNCETTFKQNNCETTFKQNNCKKVLMKNNLTGISHLDEIILMKLDPKSLYLASKVNHTFNTICKNSQKIKQKLMYYFSPLKAKEIIRSNYKYLFEKITNCPIKIQFCSYVLEETLYFFENTDISRAILFENLSLHAHPITKEELEDKLKVILFGIPFFLDLRYHVVVVRVGNCSDVWKQYASGRYIENKIQ
jgi:hypothetical protein